MSTPESKVKAKVKQLLKTYGVYYFMPATHGYGSSGVPDIVACVNGRFVGIECKANGGRITALQQKNLEEIESNHGIAVIVDEGGMGLFAMMLSEWVDNSMPASGAFFDFMGSHEDGRMP